MGIALFTVAPGQNNMVCIQAARQPIPSYVISKNKIELTPDIDVDNVLEAVKTKYRNQPINTIDGVKIEFDREWVHLRKSNTEPIIRILCRSRRRSESRCAGAENHFRYQRNNFSKTLT